jgi:Uma2 family endonuclease
MTVADVDLYDLDYLERLANEHPEWGMIEVFDGALYIQPMTSELHQLVLFQVCATLRAARPAGWRVVLDVYVRMNPSRLPRPDVVVYRTDRPVERRAVPELPALIIEVVSRDRDHDLIDKARMYAEDGVGSYVVVDPELVDGWWAKVVDEDRTVGAGEALTIDLPGWPTVELTLDQLLAD